MIMVTNTIITQDGCTFFQECIDPKIIEMLHPELSYPKWEKRQIKRKYGKYPAVYLDVWLPHIKPLTFFIPKISFEKEKEKFNFIEISA